MPKVELIVPDELTRKLEKLGNEMEEKIPEILNVGADVIVEGIKRTYTGIIRKGSGDLLRSLRKTVPKKSKSGNTYVGIEFSGYDREGTPNALKARVFEKGKNGSIGRGAMARVRAVYFPLANEKMIEKIEEIGGNKNG